MNKKEIRSNFRNVVFKRDKFCCRACGKKYTTEEAIENLDVHHITNRNELPAGGYVLENGISLCKQGNPSCHEKAEAWLSENSKISKIVGFEPEALYAKISSSFELAYKKSEVLQCRSD